MPCNPWITFAEKWSETYGWEKIQCRKVGVVDALLPLGLKVCIVLQAVNAQGVAREIDWHVNIKDTKDEQARKARTGAR